MALFSNDSVSASEDALLLQRVRQLLNVMFASGATLFVYTLIEDAVSGDTEIGNLGRLFLAGVVLAFGLGRLALAGANYSSQTVRWIEGAVFLVVGLLAALLMNETPVGYRPELSLVIVYSVFVFGRAGLVPSRVRHTLLLCVFYGIALGVVSWRTYIGYQSPGPGYPPQTSLGVTVFTETWWAVISGVALVVTRIIHGLRREASDARQLGQYRLEAKLGEGGMGEVYRARHVMLRRPTAIKLLLPGRSSESTLARFEREVQLTAKLTHPNTITVFDYGRTEDGTFYYAMELLQGATLREVVEFDGPQPAGRVLRILAQAGNALSEAHGVGLIHRDIKPENIMLTQQGLDRDAVKLLDFGLVHDVSNGDATLTKTNVVVGTPLYMPPEVIVDPTAASPKSDVYSLAAVGYFLLTGEPVFRGPSIVEICAQHLHDPPPQPSERLGRPVCERLEALLLEGLAKDPEARPQSALEFVQRVRACRDWGSWRSTDAEAWWAKHGPELRRRRADNEQPAERNTIIAPVAAQ